MTLLRVQRRTARDVNCLVDTSHIGWCENIESYTTHSVVDVTLFAKFWTIKISYLTLYSIVMVRWLQDLSKSQKT